MIANKYDIISKIGEGQFGTVYKGKYKRNVEQKLLLLPGPRIVSVHSGCAIYAKKEANYIKNSENKGKFANHL